MKNDRKEVKKIEFLLGTKVGVKETEGCGKLREAKRPTATGVFGDFTFLQFSFAVESARETQSHRTVSLFSVFC